MGCRIARVYGVSAVCAPVATFGASASACDEVEGSGVAGLIGNSASLLEGLGGTLVVAEATSLGWRARRGERRAAEVDIHPLFRGFWYRSHLFGSLWGPTGAGLQAESQGPNQIHDLLETARPTAQ